MKLTKKLREGNLMKKITTIIFSGLFFVSSGVYATNETKKHTVTNEQGTTTQSELNGKGKPDRLRTVPGQVLVRFKANMPQQAVDKALKSVKVKKIKLSNRLKTCTTSYWPRVYPCRKR